MQVSRPAEGLSLLRWKTPIDELVAVYLGRGDRWRRCTEKKINEEDTKNIDEEDKENINEEEEYTLCITQALSDTHACTITLHST